MSSFEVAESLRALISDAVKIEVVPQISTASEISLHTLAKVPRRHSINLSSASDFRTEAAPAKPFTVKASAISPHVVAKPFCQGL